MEQTAADTLKSIEPGTYSTPELAALLQCSPRHVRDLTTQGEIPGVIRLGRLVRYHRGIISQWLATRAEGGCRG